MTATVALGQCCCMVCTALRPAVPYPTMMKSYWCFVVVDIDDNDDDVAAVVAIILFLVLLQLPSTLESFGDMIGEVDKILHDGDSESSIVAAIDDDA